ncbi:RidA family protein [Roseovarius sp. MMSF_3281]|uniref:RidA family protein n=1 Tax=Roseovarius sp. MMSF_3281 TaxID=3046694 RepID=UPI00273E6FE0|nr:RidA family protein [Roseovarius sp. MMSF_3281]
MTEVTGTRVGSSTEDRTDLNAVAECLPKPEGTKYPYELVTFEGRTAYLAGQIPKRDGRLAIAGKVGREVALEDAVTAARICAEQALAWLNDSAGGLGNVKRILRVTCYVAHDDDFEDISAVADGASNYLNDMLGDQGRHARSVVGVKRLPRNAPVLIELTAALREPL